MEEEEERKPQEDNEEDGGRADVAGTPQEAYADWSALRFLRYLPAEIVVYAREDGDIEALHETLEILDYAVRWTERTLIREMDIPTSLRVAMEAVSRDYRPPYNGPRFIINDVQRGSLVVEGALVLALGAVLKAVLGKPAHEAWKTSRSRKRLVKAMRSAIDKAGDRFVEVLKLQSKESDVVVAVRAAHKKKPTPMITAELDLKGKSPPKRKSSPPN